MLVYTNLYTRTFKVDPTMLYRGLRLPESAVETNATDAVSRVLRDYFAQAGVTWIRPGTREGALLQRPPACAPGSGHNAGFDLIGVVIQVLMLPPEQDSGPDHSSDWLLGTNGVRTGRILQLKRPSEETWTAGYDTNSAKRAEVGRTWTNPVNHGLMSEPIRFARTNLVRGSQAMIARLKAIRLDRIDYDAVPLSQVVIRLNDEARKRDPEKRGVNFLLNQGIGEAGGLPELPITIKPALTNVHLLDVLDAVVKVAGKPIKYSIEDYAVVLSARTGREPPPLYVRTFKFNPKTLYQGLENAGAFRREDPDQVDNSRMGDTGGGMRFLVQTNNETSVSQAAINYFQALGVDLDPRANPGKAVFYKDRQGVLLVRATMQDLDIIEAAIQVLTYFPPQINIKCKVVEVTQDDIQLLGLDWQLGQCVGEQCRAHFDQPAWGRQRS